MEKAQTERITDDLTTFHKNSVKGEIQYLSDVSADKDLMSEKKEDFNNKLSDSACGSLNESEDSGSKCQENESNQDVEEESDSLECDDKDELEDTEGEEEEEESVDNNTFNVINSENSESQEMSEITYDESSHCEKIVEHEEKGEEQQRLEDSSTDKSRSSSDDPSSEGQENIRETSDSSKEEEEYDTSNDISNEGTSKKSEDQTETSDDHVMESDSTENRRDKESHLNEEKKTPKQSESKISQIPTPQQTKLNNLNVSPKTKRKTIPSASSAKTCDFKIEIYESKRKPDISTLKEGDKSEKDKPDTEENSSTITKTQITNSKIGSDAEKLEETTSPQNSDKLLSSEPSFSTSEVLSPESGDKTSSIMLDVSQVIKEESEESDALSPIRSLVEDSVNSTRSSETKDKDTTRKQTDSKLSPNADTTTKTNGSTSSSNNAPTTSPTTTITSSSSSSVNQKVNQCSPNQPTPPQSQNGSGSSDPVSPSPDIRKPSPMAFTVDLDSVNSDSSTSGNSAKKLNISASISQWAPKHKRNLSLTKVEEHKVLDSFFDENGNKPRERRSTISRLEKVDEKQGSEKPPLGRPRSGTVGSCPPGTKRGTAGYHSEGYFSSDQDDDRPNRTDLKSPRSPRTPDTVQAQPLLVRSNSQDSSKGASVRMRPPSPLSPSSPYGAPLNETASFIIEKMMSATPETKRKFSNTKPEGRTCCKERDRKPSVSELTGKTYKSEKKMGVDSKKPPKSPPIDDYDTSKDEKDDVSEAGTYTIDKDSPTPDEDQARNNIDGVFGITTESEAETTTTTAVPMSTTDQCPEDESSWLSASEIPSSISRSSPNWIQQWAAQVAEQTKPPVESLSSLGKSSISSPRGHSSSLLSQDGNDARPRRKLPTPPSHLAATSGLSPRSDPPSAKHRLWNDETMNSDLTSDAEGFLRDTENIVTSLQARVNKSKGGNQTFRNTSLESHESGGDSDFDTCNSYPFNDDERMSASLKSKLRLTGLTPQTKNLASQSAGIISPRRPDGGTSLDCKIKPREASYDMYNNRRDDRGLHSDSSSEASEPYKDVTRTSDKNPPLKFNRAFSLRRARLGCDEPVSTTVEKKKVNRASSAGASSSARKGTLGASKSYQSVDNASVSSPRNYGYGSPRGIASPSQNVGGSKGTPQSDNFDRTDGGRYSLRLPRSGSSSIGLSKSPSKSSIHKKEGPNNRKGATRSNSTLSSKEVDFQNWKRRKNYDPMKAAAEGRKKQVEKKQKNAQPSAQINSDNRSPSPPGSLLRSASFHGTEGVMPHVRWTRKPNNAQPQYTSEDDGPYSLEEEVGPHPSPMHGSPLHRSPTSPHQLCQSPIRHPQVRGSRRPSLGLSDEGEPQYQSGLRKVSLEESGSEGKRSPLNPGARTGSSNSATGAGRPKTKMEALDNLVISTIHSLSVKVRTTSESLLQKLKSQYDEEGDRAALLEEVLSHLSESDQSLTSGQTRSTSRELAGILRNLKKIEHALEVIDKVIIVGEEDYRDDDVDYVPTEWVEESDY